MFDTKQEIYYTVILGSIFFIFLITVIVITAFLYHNRKRAYQLEVSNFQNILLRTQLEIQEQTFKTISQEIHDNIGQMLSLAKLNLNTVDLEQKEKALNKLSDAKELVSKAIHDLRDLSKTLNADTIAAVGFVRAVEQELNMIQKAGAIQTKLDVQGQPQRLEPQKELILFRIVQEALHNVLKHAKASNIIVTAQYNNLLLLLQISDNGCGFESANDHFGSGLRNIQSRARLIGGELQIRSTKNHGTQIQINIPTTN